MADLEQDVFDAGASEATPSDLAPASDQQSVSPQSAEARAVGDAISSLRGPVPQYGVQPTPPPRPTNPDDEPVKAGVFRDLLNERTARQQLENTVRELQRKEQERAAQQVRPKAEDLLFSDPDKFISQTEQRYEKKI